MTTPAERFVELLEADHRRVEALFEGFKKTEDPEARIALAQRICVELEAHALGEETILYAHLYDRDEAGKARDKVDEAFVEHTVIKDLIRRIRGTAPGERFFEAQLEVLEELVEHHVEEEERDVFPRVRAMDLPADLPRKFERYKDEVHPTLVEASACVGDEVRLPRSAATPEPPSTGGNVR